MSPQTEIEYALMVCKDTDHGFKNNLTIKQQKSKSQKNIYACVFVFTKVWNSKI